jgi:hypothetical protein
LPVRYKRPGSPDGKKIPFVKDGFSGCLDAGKDGWRYGNLLSSASIGQEIACRVERLRVNVAFSIQRMACRVRNYIVFGKERL